MTRNSDGNLHGGAATLPLPDAQFTAVNGTMAPPSDPFSAGLADSTFTSTNGMNASACAQVDNEQECAAITVTAPSFSIDDVTLSEGTGGTTAFTFTVTKTGATGLSATVDYETVNGSATAPSDFTAITPTTLIFPATGPGSDSQTVTVSVNADLTYETNEAFTVHLSNATNATISDADGTGTINNDDAAPTLTINDVSLQEGSPPGIPPGPTKNFSFIVTRTGATEVGSTVNFASANGTTNPAVGGVCGTPGVDYNSNSGMVTFPASGPGSTSQTITIQVCRDTVYELNETFFVDLSSAVDATISDNQGLGTATNDDNPPSLTVNGVSQFEGHSGITNFVFNVTKTGDTEVQGSVDFVTNNNSAIGDLSCGGGGDYTTTFGTLTFDPAETLETVTVEVCGDRDVEPDEIFRLSLSNGQHVQIVDFNTDGTILNDEPEVSVAVSPSSVVEDSAPANMVYTFTRNITNGTVTINFSVGGTADATNDYTQAGADTFNPVAGTVTFADGSPTATVTVTPTTDNTDEPDETVILTVTSGIGYTIATSPNDSATGTITDDDNAPTISIGDVTLPEGNSGTTQFVFTVSLSNPSSTNVTVDYQSAVGGATPATAGVCPGGDFEIVTGTVTFTPGQISNNTTVSVPVCGELANEPDETFVVDLSNNSANSTILDGQGLGTIQNDDCLITPTIVYVDDNFANPTPGEDPDAGGPATNFGCDSFATIQEGVERCCRRRAGNR